MNWNYRNVAISEDTLQSLPEDDVLDEIWSLICQEERKGVVEYETTVYVPDDDVGVDQSRKLLCRVRCPCLPYFQGMDVNGDNLAAMNVPEADNNSAGTWWIPGNGSLLADVSNERRERRCDPYAVPWCH